MTACNWDSSRFFVISGNVFDPFIYYSHFTPLALSLFIGLFIIFKNPREITNQILFGATTLFSLWVVCDLIIWATEKPHFTMFFWSLEVLIEPFIYLALLYFIHVLIKKSDISLSHKILMVLPLLPTIVLAFSSYALAGYGLFNCDRDAVEGPLAHYGYVLEVFYVLWITVFSIEQWRKQTDSKVRGEIVIATLGVLLFLLTFSWGNIVGSFSDDWKLPQWGLFGMPVFIAFLSYLVVEYEALNIKVLGAQVLMLTLIALMGSVLLLVIGTTVKIILGLTLACTIVVGYFLVRSVKAEVRAKEQLAIANKQQENLLHFISHEIKGYLTKGEGAFAEIAAGSFGVPTDGIKHMSESALAEMRKGVDTVMYILKASDFKKGTVTYEKKPFDFKKTVLESIAALKPEADEKHLAITTAIGDGDFTFTGDEEKIRQHVTRNLIENAIKYTPSGSITVSLAREGATIRFAVQDTGVGITPEDMKNLFTQGGHGKDSIKVNVHSTGYGLFIAKQVVESHGGKIWAESAGAGKGTRMVVEVRLSE